jgi:O-antigen/teichoic acid export membrane protein
MANRTALVALAARAAGMAGAFAMTVAITRSLSKPHAGLVLLTYTLLTVAATLARFGADNLALREVSKGGADRAALVRHSVGVALIGSPVAMALLAVALMAQGDGTTDPSLVLAACLAVFPAAMSIIAGAVLRGLSRLAAGMLAELGSPALLATVGIAALGLTGRSSATSAVWMLALGNAVTMVWSWWLIRRTLPEVRRRAAGFRVYLSTFRPALAAFFTTSIGFFLLAWLPVLVLGFAILDPTQANLEVARYNAAARLAQFVPLVSVIQISYLSQQFASLHHRERSPRSMRYRSGPPARPPCGPVVSPSDSASCRRSRCACSATMPMPRAGCASSPWGPCSSSSPARSTGSCSPVAMSAKRVATPSRWWSPLR